MGLWSPGVRSKRLDGSSTSGRSTWKTGDVLAGRYKITGVLGAGGMGKVFKAWDEQLGREVALKTLTSATLIEEEVVRFQREAQAASQLRHASVIDCYDFGVLESGQPYMVMEYIDGVTLKNVLKRDGAFDADHALSILRRVADGLTAIHRAGIVHRDLNLGNIMIIESDTGYSIKILDFGIARRELPLSEASLTRKDAIVGNPLYMSPEQARGDEVDERSDIYSLGCIGFELLAGVPPFRAGNALATIKMHNDEDMPPLSSMLTREQPCVEMLDSMLRRATAKAVADRFQSAEEFKIEVERVRRVLQDSVASESNEPPVEKLGDKIPMPTILIVSAVSVLVLLGVAAALPQIHGFISPSPKKAKVIKETFFSDASSHPKQDPTLIYAEESALINSKAEKLGGAVGPHVYIGENALENFRKDVANGSRVNEPVFKRVLLTNADVKLISRLHPTNIWFFATGLDDESLRIISQIKDLQDIRMCEEKKITPAGLKALGKLKKLWMLVLIDMDLDDRAAAVLKDFPRLQQLSLERNRRITAKGLETLAKSKTLEQIAIAGCACAAVPSSKVAAFEKQYGIKLHTTALWNEGAYALEEMTKTNELFPP